MIKLFKWIVDHVDSDIIIYSILSVSFVLLCLLFWFISEVIKYLDIDSIFEALRLGIVVILSVVLALLVVFGVFFIIVAILAGVEKLVIKLFDKFSDKYQSR